MTVREVAVEEPTCTHNWVPLLLLTAFTFPGSEESPVPIYCWVNPESVSKILCSACFEPGTFSTSGEHSNQSATGPRRVIIGEDTLGRLA